MYCHSFNDISEQRNVTELYGVFIWDRAQKTVTNRNCFYSPQITYKYLQNSFLQCTYSFILEMTSYRNGKLKVFFFSLETHSTQVSPCKRYSVRKWRRFCFQVIATHILFILYSCFAAVSLLSVYLLSALSLCFLCVYVCRGFWHHFFHSALPWDSTVTAFLSPSACNHQDFGFGSSSSHPCCGLCCSPRVFQIFSFLGHGYGFWPFCHNQNGPVCYSPQNAPVLKTQAFPWLFPCCDC